MTRMPKVHPADPFRWESLRQKDRETEQLWQRSPRLWVDAIFPAVISLSVGLSSPFSPWEGAAFLLLHCPAGLEKRTMPQEKGTGGRDAVSAVVMWDGPVGTGAVSPEKHIKSEGEEKHVRIIFQADRHH